MRQDVVNLLDTFLVIRRTSEGLDLKPFSSITIAGRFGHFDLKFAVAIYDQICRTTSITINSHYFF